MRDAKEKAKQASMNKKKTERKKKKRAELAKAADLEEEELSGSGSSFSEADSPVKGMRARIDRMGMTGAARRAFTFEGELLNMNTEEATDFAESVTKALAAKKPGTPNSPIFRAEVTPNRNSERGRTEDLVADTGCTRSIIGAKICKDNGITVYPLAGMKITDASGNLLKIVGTCEFYILSQVLATKKRRVKAAVLEGNDLEREILISMDLLKKWDMIHPTFPAKNINDYINSLNKPTKKKHYSSAYRAVY